MAGGEGDRDEPETCSECGQEIFCYEVGAGVWWGCGCGDHVTLAEGGE